VSRSFLGESSGTPLPAEYQRLEEFYHRWGPESFLTWDLPLPIEPELHGFTSYSPPALSRAGVNLFLPWSILRDGQLTLHELAAHLRTAQNPDHLSGWLKATSETGQLMYKRFHDLLVLYRYRELALASRFGDRFSRVARRLDRAFAQLLHLTEHSAKQLRLHLARSVVGA
jgi:hypothetical protein